MTAAMAAEAVAKVESLNTDSTTYAAGILDRQTGQEFLGRNGAVQFYSGSVVKLFVVVDLLHQEETGDISLDRAARTDIQRALELSDDNAMDALWVNYDGAAAVRGMVALAHLKDTELPARTGEWGWTEISARDVLAVYQYALTSLSPTDRDLVVGDLGQAADNGADGFYQAFGLLAEPRLPNVKAKQCWMMWSQQGMMMLHTTGLLGSQNQFVVAILTRQPADYGWDVGRRNVNTATTDLLHVLGPTVRG